MSRFWKQQRLFLQPISQQDLSILGASCCRRERFWLISGSAGSWRHRIHLSPLPPLLQISSKFSQIFWKFAKLCEVSPLFRLCLRSDPEESVGIHPSWSGWQLSPRPLSISWLQISQNPPVAPHPAPSGRSLRNGARHWKPLFFATILVTLASVLSALSLSSRCHKGSTMNRQQGIDPTYIAISIFSRCQGSNGNALQSLKQTWLPPSASSTKTPLFPFPTGFLAEVRGIYSKTKVFFIKIKLQSVCTQCMLLRGEEQKTSGTLTSKVLVSGAILMLSTTLQ